MPKRAAKQLTDASLRKLKAPKSGRVQHWDAIVPGLCLRITHNDHRSWCFVRRVNDRWFRVTLGTYTKRGQTTPTMSLAEARTRASKMADDLGQGNDPRVTRAVEKEDAKRTVKAAGEAFMQEYVKGRNRSWKETQRIFLHDVYPLWGNRPLFEISSRDVRTLIERINDRGSGIMANRTLAAVRKFFNWCAEPGREWLQANPAMGVQAVGRESSRERTLTNEEIRALWAAWGEMGQPFGNHMKLILATGQRPGEVAQMKWEDIDFMHREWSLWTCSEKVEGLSDSVGRDRRTRWANARDEFSPKISRRKRFG